MGVGSSRLSLNRPPENKLPVCTVPLAHVRKEGSLSSSARCPSELAENGTRAQAFRVQGLRRFPSAFPEYLGQGSLTLTEPGYLGPVVTGSGQMPLCPLP